jgi:hypothetical protein
VLALAAVDVGTGVAVLAGVDVAEAAGAVAVAEAPTTTGGVLVGFAAALVRVELGVTSPPDAAATLSAARWVDNRPVT